MTEEKIRYQIEVVISVASSPFLDFSRKTIPAEFRQFVSDLPEGWTAEYRNSKECLMCQYHRYLEHPVAVVGGVYWTEIGYTKRHPLAFWEYAMTLSRPDCGNQFTKPQLQLAIKIYDELYPPINGIPHDITPVQPIEPVKEGVTVCS